MRYAFFGTPGVACTFLDALTQAGMPPALIVTAPDKPAGRGMELKCPPVAQWASKHGIPLLQPEKLDTAFIEHMRAQGPWDVFIVIAYGAIFPQELIDLPAYKTLNVHFSLLPRWRGASPVESPILAGDGETGCAIQVMRAKLDTGPVVALEKTPIGEDETAPALRARLGEIGSRLLVETLPRYTAGELTPAEQDDAHMTYAKKMKKEDGDITHDDDITRWRKYRAYAEWPGTCLFTERGGKTVRLKIAAARFEDDRFVIDRVIPEGKKEMSYADFLRSSVAA
ncbi:methionyl-tRNA formyltransferase [Candidatus Kaiserbacteria bacterium]|nr:methionyl-tRNA formyltransferase [Candidatus Kaiserbacteria bacterium]